MESFEFDVGAPIYTFEYTTFDMFFAAVVSANEHPNVIEKKTLLQCRDLAMDMVEVRRALPVIDYRTPEQIEASKIEPEGKENV